MIINKRIVCGDIQEAVGGTLMGPLGFERGKEEQFDYWGVRRIVFNQHKIKTLAYPAL